MATCEYCGEAVSMPYTCSLCGNKYDGKHRLPESHQCINLHRFQTPEYKQAKKSKKNDYQEVKSGSYASAATVASYNDGTPFTQRFWQASTRVKTVILAGLTLGLVMQFVLIFRLLLTDFAQFITFGGGILVTTTLGMLFVYYLRNKKARKLDVQTDFLFWQLGVIITFITAIISFMFTILAFGYFTNMGSPKNSTEVVKASNYAYISFFAVFRMVGIFGLISGVLPSLLSAGIYQGASYVLFFGVLMMIPWGRLDGITFYGTDRRSFIIHIVVMLLLVIVSMFNGDLWLVSRILG